MFALLNRDGISVNELARRTQLGKSRLTSMFNHLEIAGLVRQVPSRIERRTILVVHIDKGRDMEKQYVRLSEQMTGIYYKRFSVEQADRSLRIRPPAGA